MSAHETLTDRQVRQGMRINIIAGSMGMMWVAVALGIPLTMFMESIGASGVVIGLTVTVQQLAMVFQIPSAFFAERLPARKPYWATVALVHRLLWFTPAILPLVLPHSPRNMAYIMVAVVTLSAVLTNACAAAWWSWITDLVPERLRGSFWGRRQSVSTMAHLLAVWGAGRLLDIFSAPSGPVPSYAGFALVFGVGAALGCADIITHIWVPEPPPHTSAERSGMLQKFLAPLRNVDFRRVTLAFGLWTFGIGMIGQFGMLYLKRDFGLSYTLISATTISASLGVIVSGVAWGYVMDRLGSRNLGAITIVVAPVFGLCWFFMRDISLTIDLPLLAAITLPQPMWILLVVNLVAGAFYGAAGLAQVGLLAGTSPQEGRIMAMATHWSIVGLLAALGPLVGGWVMDWFDTHPFDWVLPTGTRISFFHFLVVGQMLVSWALAVPVLLKINPRVGEVGFRTALSHLFVANPLRAVSHIINIYAMTMSVSSRRRATAARNLGMERSAIAVRDLIENLDDPAAEVREEAVAALGRIGSQEAVAALLRKFDDPTSDVIPQIARALREARQPISVEHLMKKLSDSDRETVTEAARALGAIGDRRAAAALMKLLRGSEDAKVISASSEALARLGEMAAIYEILPRMAATQNHVLKQSLAVAVGDLLGEPGEFYKILVREHRVPGIEVERLLDQLGESIAAAAANRMPDQGNALVAKVQELQAAFEGQRFDACMQWLFDLAIGLAALRYGIEFGGDSTVFVEAMIWHDQHFGIGVWYLDMLRRSIGKAGSRPVGDIDVLLGIYFLSGWTYRQEHGGARLAAPAAEDDGG